MLVDNSNGQFMPAITSPFTSDDQSFSEIKGRDIVVTGIQHWDTRIGSNLKNIASRLAKQNRVLYVNFPISRKSYLSKTHGEIETHCRIIKKKEEPLREAGTNMWVYYPTSLIESAKWLPSTGLFKMVTRINNRRFAGNIKEAIAKLGFKDIILFNDNDIYNGYYLKELLHPSMYIYYFKDFLQGYSYWKKHASVMEPELLKKVDAVVTNSMYYEEYCLTVTPNAHYIGQGCDLRLFNPYKEHVVPDDIKKLSSPIIGYTGVLDSERLDERILLLLAEENPDWNIVLAGPSDAFFEQSRLHSFSNVHFLGRKPLEQLPSYLAAFDICMNPQLTNQITRGNYPLKIDEYLAMGKPVVATRTQAMKLFEPYSYLADRPEDYAGLIRRALQEDNEQKKQERISFANSHTWENCILEINKTFSKYYPRASKKN
jgi:teichuronic acid biosynthesis glycosyltransferase TuaH